MHRFRTPSSALCDLSAPITDMSLSLHPFALHREGPLPLWSTPPGWPPCTPGLNAV